VRTECSNDHQFEIVAGGLTGSDGNGVRAFAEAGATWWVEGYMGTLSFEKVRERLRQGLPAPPA
jgi:hypothetical protein